LILVNWKRAVEVRCFPPLPQSTRQGWSIRLKKSHSAIDIRSSLTVKLGFTWRWILDKLAEFAKTLPEELQNIPAVFYAPYGFKIVEINDRKLWTPGTFEDYQQFQAKRLGVEPETIKPKKLGDRSCYNSSPTTCAGTCPQYSECAGEIVAGYASCGCYS